MKIKIAEYFMSVQGEGISAGIPSLFIRFPGCNLQCGGHMGSLVKNGKATWWCDTEAVWMAGKEIDTREIAAAFPFKGFREGYACEAFHIVFTGGEPCLVKNTEYARSILEEISGVYGRPPYLEVETNGTVESPLLDWVDQINCSPKLSNSGLPKAQRIKREVIDHFLERDKVVQFKFVLSNRSDFWEMLNLAKELHIPLDKIVMMPAVDKRSDLAEATKFVWELSVESGIRMCSRLHILCYDKLTGV